MEAFNLGRVAGGAERHIQWQQVLVSRVGLNRARRLPTIEGIVPSLYDLPRGCRFAERCPFNQERCVEIEPGLAPAPPGASDVPTSDGVPGASRLVRCHFPLADAAPGAEVRTPQPGGIGA